MENINVPCQDTMTLELSSKDEPMLMFNSPTKEVLRITHDRKVIVSGDIYEAAQTFWDIVKQCAPDGYIVEQGPTPA